MLIGYARISTHTQDLSLQLDALRKAGCERIYEDTLSGTRADRPELSHALDALRPDDTLVVWKLDRLGRSLKHLLEIMASLDAQGVNFRSLTESIDTSSSMGRFFFSVMGALSQMERDLIAERTQAGLQVARARGRLGGRPQKLDSDKLQAARSLLEKGRSMQEVAEILSVHRATLYRGLRRR